MLIYLGVTAVILGVFDWRRFEPTVPAEARRPPAPPQHPGQLGLGH